MDARALRWAGAAAVAAAAVVAATDPRRFAGGEGRQALAQEMRPEALKIGVVDLGRVFKEYHRSAELDTKVKAEEKGLDQKLEEAKDRLRKVREEMDLLDPNAEAFHVKEEELAIELARFDFLKKRFKRDIDEKKRGYTLVLIEDIERVVRAYGKEKGYTFILKAESDMREEEKLLVGLRSVLYYAPSIDVTPPIIDILNAQVPKKAPEGPPSPPPGSPPPGTDKDKEKKQP